MRFDDEAYLAAWASHNAYPVIHDKIADMAVNHMRGTSALDLCCCTGLLGTRLMSQMGIHAVGIEGNVDDIALAKDYGIPMEINHLVISPATVNEIDVICQRHRVDVVVARRCLPELFGMDLEFGRRFAGLLKDWGIKEVFLEGRQPTKNAVNALASLKAEIDLLAPVFTPVRVQGHVAYLT